MGGEDVDEMGLDPIDGTRTTETDDGKKPDNESGYSYGDTVVATRDLSVGGKVVVRANVLGRVNGFSAQGHAGRITVSFSRREDKKTNNLNVVPSEIRKVDPNVVYMGELCAICLGDLVDGVEDICRMPCGHVLHAACIRAYLSHQVGSTSTLNRPAAATALAPAQCPVCRRE